MCSVINVYIFSVQCETSVGVLLDSFGIHSLSASLARCIVQPDSSCL